MPRRKKKSEETNQLPQAQQSEPSTGKEKDLNEFLAEAAHVKFLAESVGWAILKRDLIQFRNSVAENLGYLSPRKPEFDEARIRFLAADHIIKMVEDYEENKRKAEELLKKLESSDEIPFDYDAR